MSAAANSRKRIPQTTLLAALISLAGSAAVAQDRAARAGGEQLDEPAASTAEIPQSPATGQNAQQPADAAADAAEQLAEAAQQSRAPIVTDADRVRWLAAKLKNVAALDEFAAQRISNSQVKELSQNSARELKQQVALIEQAAEQRSQEAWTAAREQAEGGPDLSETIGEIGEAVQARMRQRADRRATAGTDAAPATQNADPATQTASDDRENRRRVIRERLGVLLPAVREELPELLELLGEAVEDEGSGPAAWVSHQNRIDEQVLKAKQDELARYEGDRFLQAYLGMRLVSAIELEAASHVVVQNTDQTLNELLSETTDLLEQQAEQCRQLMDQQYQPNARVAAGSDDHAADDDNNATNPSVR